MRIMTDTTIIRTEDLTKAYGKKVAVNHLSLEIRRGEIFGLRKKGKKKKIKEKS